MVAVWETDKVVTKTTGKHLHEHVFEWWCEMRDDIERWIREHSNLRIRKVCLALLNKADGVAVQAKRMTDKVTLRCFAISAKNQEYEICTKEVSQAEEAMAQFPDLRLSQVHVFQEY